MGRPPEILAPKKAPGAHRQGGRVPWNILMAMFVVVILFLVIFTDLDETPRAAQPAAPVQVHKKRVDGVLLYRDKSPVRDAGAAD